MPLVVKNLSHIYMPKSPFEQVALDDISMTIEDGSFTAVIGHTGSGKSTLMQHFNALLKPTSGQIILDGVDIAAKETDLRSVRRRIGLVFQYPEYQLFEETIYKDIAFGPKNNGLDEDEIDERVREACALVNLDFNKMKDRSPFEISGGQKRRVAIAGVLAMRPQILILDEPAAGLDPRGREEILSLIKKWHENGTTIVMVSHSMDDVARYAEHIFVLSKGRLILQGDRKTVFSQEELLLKIGLGLPQAAVIAKELRSRGIDIPEGCYVLEEVESHVLAALKGGRENGS
jgi:energy-coupling factor transport system ATP-binding protein